MPVTDIGGGRKGRRPVSCFRDDGRKDAELGDGGSQFGKRGNSNRTIQALPYFCWVSIIY